MAPAEGHVIIGRSPGHPNSTPPPPRVRGKKQQNNKNGAPLRSIRPIEGTAPPGNRTPEHHGDIPWKWRPGVIYIQIV